MGKVNSTNDVLASASTITYGGALIVTILAARSSAVKVTNSSIPARRVI